MATPADRKVIAYMADISDVKAKLNELAKLNSKVSSNMGGNMASNFRKVGDSIGQIKTTEVRTGLNDLSNTATKTSQNFRGLDGSLMQVTRTTNINAKGVATTTTAYKDLNTNTVGLGENMMRLAKRAALTIPLWLVLRGTVMGVISTFKNGIQAIKTQDEAFQKARRTISGSTEEISKNFDILRESVLALSLETGESIEKITQAFYKFSTVGFSFEDSMKGAEYATKTAITMFGDAEETANVFARAMRVLVDRSEGAASAGEQIGNAMSQTAELWKNNAFELGEFTQSLEKFAGTAKAVNFTTQQTISLLASLSTAGLRGGRAGTLLRTSIVKLLSNLDKLSGTLGVKVNPQIDTTYDVLMRVLEAIHGLDAGSKVAAQTADAIGEIFGGVRGMEAVLALKALREEMLKNTQVVSNLDNLNDSFENVTQTTNRLMTQIQNLNREIGKTFVVGIVGGKNFTDSLETILSVLKQIQTRIDSFGTGLRIAFKAATLQLGNFGAEFDRLGESRLSKVGKEFKETFDLENIMDAGIIRDLLSNINKWMPTGLLDKYDKKQQEEVKNLLLLRLDALEKIAETEKSVTSEVEKQAQVVERSLAPKEKQEISTAVLNVELDRLKALGASNSQILQANALLMERLGIEEKTIDKITRQLELERSLSEERRLQSELGNESLKLFRIAQESGVDVAKRIGDVLAGTTDFDTFLRLGGEAADVFKKEFSDIFEQQQAKRFFQGLTIPGLEDLRGGFGVAIQEQAIRQRGIPTTGAMITQSRMEGEFQRLMQPTEVSAPVTMDINVDISSLEGISDAIISQISAELPRVGSAVNSALQTAMKNSLVGKQSPTV